MLDPTGSDGWKAFNIACWVLGGVCGVLLAILGYLGIAIRRRVDTSVTREELHKYMEQQSAESAQLRADRKEMHEENKLQMRELKDSMQGGFEKLDRKIDEHETINSDARGKMNDSMQSMAVQMGILSERVGPRPIGFNQNR